MRANKSTATHKEAWIIFNLRCDNQQEVDELHKPITKEIKKHKV